MQPLPQSDLKELLTLLQQALAIKEEDREAWLATIETSHRHLKPTLADLLHKPAVYETDDLVAARAIENASAAVGLTPAPFVGALIGPYRLLNPIGEGGMSSVWRAEREDGVLRRKVALKLPHWWALSKLTDRAAQERDILATLEHPNIARLYDAGITADGRPYLALEYIEGRPIDTYCQQTGAVVRLRIQLLVQVVRAVAYAHSRLVVHRDLKPSNILVDAQGQVHLLDFGIAKLIEASSANNKAFTQVGARVLTPEYAAPEQMIGQPVTTQSDVYSLGMVAYELLTGRAPYQITTPTSAEHDVLSSIVAPPSSVAQAGDAARALRGDLDTIIGKALKKEPSERYASAAALADDLERYLRGDPVLAQPDSTSYRLRKFASRNRLAVGAAAAVVLALAAGLLVATWQLRIAREEKRHAEEVKEFVASIFRSADPYFSGSREMTAAKLLTLAKDRIDREMASQPANAAELLLIVGEAQGNLELTDDAYATLSVALERGAGTLPADSLQIAAGEAQLAQMEYLRGATETASSRLQAAIPKLRAYRQDRNGARALANALNVAAFIKAERGDRDGSIADLHEAVDVSRTVLGPQDSETILIVRQLAQEHLMFNEVDEALKHARAAYEDANRYFSGDRSPNLLVEAEDVYGRALADSGQLEEGIKHMRNALQGAIKILGPQADGVTIKLTWLARAQLKLGDLPGAIQTLKQSVDASTTELTRARASASYGASLATARKLDEALAVLKPAYEQLQAIDKSGGAWIGNAGAVYGNALVLAGRNDEAEKVLKANVARGEGIGPALAESHAGLGHVALARKDYAAAKSSFDTARSLLAGAPPSRVTVNELLGRGLLQIETKDFAGAESSLKEAEAAQRKLVVRPTPTLADIVAARARLEVAQGKRPD
jgi:eukaryotic-like serine/threonine-protein kinase